MSPVLIDRPTTTVSNSAASSQNIGPYRVLKRIATGGSSIVYQAVADDGSKVAIKVLSEDVALDDTRLLRFYQEARCLLRLSHPNLIAAHQVGESQGRHFLAMEYVEGETLVEHIVHNGRMDESKALRIAIDLASGLRAVHEQDIIHRDVSPKNVLIDKNGQVRLGDFEFSKDGGVDLDLTVQGMGLGTPDFMSPEQFQRAKDVDARSDVYSLGATLYVMLTGRLPFPGKTMVDKWLAKSKNHYLSPKTLNKKLSRGAIALIKNSMSANPDKRPQTAREFAELAQRCLDGLEFQNSRSRSTTDRTVALWKVILITNKGDVRKVKATEEQLTAWIGQRRIAADARVCAEGSGKFLRLCQTPRFQRLFERSPMTDALDRANQQVKKKGNRLLVDLGAFLQSLGRRLGS